MRGRFVNHPEFVWGLIASLYVANFFTLLINIGFIPVFVWMLKLPFSILAPIIFILCVVGGYASTQDMHDVWLMLLFGIVGYLMRKLDYPMAPAVLAIVLGPLFETSMRQSLLIGHGSFSIFFTRPNCGRDHDHWPRPVRVTRVATSQAMSPQERLGLRCGEGVIAGGASLQV